MRNKRGLHFLGGILLLLCSFVADAKKDHLTPSQQKTQFKEYYESGNYYKDIEYKLKDAKDYLLRQIQNPRPKPLAIVLDIDETALSNYTDLERLSFTHNEAALTGAHMLGHANPILPVLALYQLAVAHKVAVFFISERPNTPEIMAATVKNLKSAGFEQWQELILKPLESDQMSIQEFKTASRRHIAAQGYDIVLNIGDQDPDLQSGYAEVKVKIPNPFYSLTS